jgi:HrpA-like RNA helicase
VLSLLDEANDESLMVAVTQPRRVGAVSLASRVAEEMNTTVGSGNVGFTVRFEDNCSANTKSRFGIVVFSEN